MQNSSITYYSITLVLLGNMLFAKELYPNNNKVHLTEAANSRFEFTNDAFNGSDNGVSNAVSLQLHSPIHDDWKDIPTPAKFLNSFGAWLPGFSGKNFKKRISISVSQLIQTPTDITSTEPIANDVAYLGLLTFATGFSAYNDNEYRGLNVVVGVTGEASFAEQAQNFAHEGLGQAEVAQGWDDQVGIAPIFNVGAQYKKKFIRAGNPAGLSFDTSFSGEGKIGNAVTELGARLETRFGFNVPGGFAPIPDPVGRFMQYDARLAPERPDSASIYSTASLHVASIAHIVLTDGTLVRDEPEIAGSLVERESIVGFLFLGLHYERSYWGIHIQHVITSDFVKASSASASSNPENSFTTLSFEWRL